MSYEVLLGDQPLEFIEILDEKSTRIVKNNLLKLEDDPYPRPGSGSGDVEQIAVDGEEAYRIHISRTFTAFYLVEEDTEEVRVFEILPIDEAHNRYEF